MISDSHCFRLAEELASAGAGEVRGQEEARTVISTLERPRFTLPF